jgi:hypothetical protein
VSRHVVLYDVTPFSLAQKYGGNIQFFSFHQVPFHTTLFGVTPRNIIAVRRLKLGLL